MLQRITLVALAMACAALPARAADQEEMTQQAIRERVAVLRSERLEKMPYLDRAFVRAAIHPKSLEAKQAFISGGPKTLRQIIERAIHADLQARVAHEKEELAKRRILAAVRNLLPSAGVEMSDEDGNLSGAGYTRKNLVAKFRQPVFHGGILWNTLLKEKATLQQNAKEREQIIADLVQDVSKAYFEYQRALLVVRERKNAGKEITHFSEISQKKWDAKIISEIEHLNVQSMVSQLDYDYQTAVQELELARLELQKYLDLDNADELDIAPLYDASKLLPPAPADETDKKKVTSNPARAPLEAVKIPAADELVDMAYLNRPELQMAAARLRAAKLEERIQWGAMLPEVDVIIETGKDAEAFTVDSLDPGFRTQYKIGLEFKWNVGGNKLEYDFTNDKRPPSVTTFQGGQGSQVSSNTLKVGLLDGLEVFANTKNAEVEKLEQVVELDKAEKEVVKSVKEAYYDYQKAAIQLKSGMQRLNYRERLVRFSKHRMEKNEIETSEYLQSSQEFLNQKVEVHKTMSEYYSAKAKLNRAVGKRDFLMVEKALT